MKTNPATQSPTPTIAPRQWVMPAALDRYPRHKFFGNKKTLLADIANLIPPEAKTIADIFSGTGIVSWFLKNQGYRVISNDIMGWPNMRLRALVANNVTTLTAEDVQRLCEPCPDSDKQKFITEYYGSSLGTENCDFLENWAGNLSRLADPIKRDIAIYVCIVCIARHINYFSIHFNALGELGGCQRLSRFNFKNEVCDYALQDFPAFVYDNGCQNECHNVDAIELVSQIKADVLYCDSPYASPAGSYETQFAFLDDLVTCLSNHGERIVDPYDNRSDLPKYANFGSRRSALSEFARLFDRSRHIPCLIVSYNTTSEISAKQIESIARAYQRKDISVHFIPRQRPTLVKGPMTTTEEVLMVCR